MRMAKFVRVRDGDGEILVALSSIRKIMREGYHRASVVQLEGGDTLYECAHEYMATPNVADCIVEIGGSDES